MVMCGCGQENSRSVLVILKNKNKEQKTHHNTKSLHFHFVCLICPLSNAIGFIQPNGSYIGWVFCSHLFHSIQYTTIDPKARRRLCLMLALN